MQVETIQVERHDALYKIAQLKKLNRKLWTAEDEKLEKFYQRVRNGARVIDVDAAFRQTGVNERGEPKLAIAKADWEDAWCFRYYGGSAVFKAHNRSWDCRITQIALPDGTLDFSGTASLATLSAPVPYVPPDIRPKSKLSNFHILFEVKEWKVYPRDPFLLRRIADNFYIVEAEWELTELESSLLGAMRKGN